jgi:serine/threonine-protein kinase
VNLTEGTTLSGRYTLTRRIAAGGMGEVWSATDTVLDRNVAVKLLHPALGQETSFVERFRAEARHTAALHHPNIATVFDYGEDHGTAYIVMELVAGQTLSDVIAARAPMSAQETASILIQAANALQVAHQGGVVHRDVKPANILITADGTAKLTDFGISRAIDAVPLTQTGQVLGTAHYLSPEQALGQGATASSDIYALGVVGHEMLTGARPFNADSVVAIALAQVNQPPPPLPDTVPIGIRDVINAALAKDPGGRPATASAMAQALGRPDAAFAAGAAAAPALIPTTEPIPTLPSPSGARLPTRRRRGRRRPAWLLGAAAGAVLLAVLAAAVFSDVGPEAPAAPTAPTNISAPSTGTSTQDTNTPRPSTNATSAVGTPAASSSVNNGRRIAPKNTNPNRRSGKDGGSGNDSSGSGSRGNGNGNDGKGRE